LTKILHILNIQKSIAFGYFWFSVLEIFPFLRKRLVLDSTFFVWWDPIFVIWWISTHHSSIKLYGSAHSTYWSTCSYRPDEHIAEARWSILMWKNCYGRLPFGFFGLVFGEKYGFWNFRFPKLRDFRNFNDWRDSAHHPISAGMLKIG